MSKPRTKLMAVLVLLGLAAVGCTKENVVNDTYVVATVTQSATYTVDGIQYYANPQNDDEWSDFLDRMFALAEEGHTVQFWRSAVQNGNATKDVLTYITTDLGLAKKWAKQKKEEGYVVSIHYNQETGEYHCIAVR